MLTTAIIGSMWAAMVIVSAGNARALRWASWLAASYAVTVGYTIVGLPWPPVFAIAIDAYIYLTMRHEAATVWERMLSSVLLFSLLPSVMIFAELSNPLTIFGVSDRMAYAYSLEVINVAMMAILFAGRLGRGRVEIHRRGGSGNPFRRLIDAACARREPKDFWTHR